MGGGGKGLGRKMVLLELRHPYLQVIVIPLHLSALTYCIQKAEIGSRENQAYHHVGVRRRLWRPTQALLRFKSMILIFLMKARSRAQLVMTVLSLIDFCRTEKDG